MTGTLGPLDHIARPPLPWRTEPDLTECGKLISELAGRVVTRSDVEARVKAIGKQRAAFETCMTCAGTSDRRVRRQPHDDGAINALARELSAVQHAYPPRNVHFEGRTTHEEPNELWERKRLLAAELKAIVALVEAHRDEFDGYLAGLSETVSLADRRARQRRAR